MRMDSTNFRYAKRFFANNLVKTDPNQKPKADIDFFYIMILSLILQNTLFLQK